MRSSSIISSVALVACMLLAHCSNVGCLDGKTATHPYLYFSREELPKVIKASLTTHKMISEIIANTSNALIDKQRHFVPRHQDAFSDHWNTDYGDALTGIAMNAVLQPENEKAFDVALAMMRNLTLVPDWRIYDSPKDCLPPSHTLMGLSHAYDFLYDRIPTDWRDKIKTKICKEMRKLNQMTNNTWITRTHLQNHVAVCNTAMFIGAMACNDGEDATAFRDQAIKTLVRAYDDLTMIVDGSFDEGIHYALYTTRALTQFLHLTKRHLQRDLLQERKWACWFSGLTDLFMYTALPGYTRSNQIGDTKGDWLYGPISQLLFVDSQVVRSGVPTWVSQAIIVESEGNGPTHFMQINARGLPLRFFVYDETVKARVPDDNLVAKVHTFSDWGVTTYGGWQPREASFLSLKAGFLLGRALNTQRRHASARQKKELQYNAGHEHPDHGSFVFYSKGVPFVTDTLFNWKYTYLNNAMTFAPAAKTNPFYPNEGQFGETKNTWLDYNKAWLAEGRLVSSYEMDKSVVMTAEFSGWYRKSLGIDQIYRSVVLIKDGGLLLVTDRVALKQNTTVKTMNSYFNNIYHNFILDPPQGARLDLQQDHAIRWRSDHHFIPAATVHNLPQDGKITRTSVLNLTWPVREGINTFAFLFSPPDSLVSVFNIDSSSSEGIQVSIATSSKEYTVKIATRHANTRSRFRFLNHLGFADVHGMDASYTVAVLAPGFGTSFILCLVAIWAVNRLRKSRRVARACPRRCPMTYLTVCLILLLISLVVLTTPHGQFSGDLNTASNVAHHQSRLFPSLCCLIKVGVNNDEIVSGLTSGSDVCSCQSTRACDWCLQHNKIPLVVTQTESSDDCARILQHGVTNITTVIFETGLEVAGTEQRRGIRNKDGHLVFRTDGYNQDMLQVVEDVYKEIGLPVSPDARYQLGQMMKPSCMQRLKRNQKF